MWPLKTGFTVTGYVAPQIKKEVLQLFHTFLCNSQNYQPMGAVDELMHCCHGGAVHELMHNCPLETSTASRM